MPAKNMRMPADQWEDDRTEILQSLSHSRDGDECIPETVQRMEDIAI